MSDYKTPAEHADVAAEAIRAINHLTRISQVDWEYPGDAYSTVANLAAMVHRLPQALDQIAAFVTRLSEEDHLRADRDLDPAALAASIRVGLNLAKGDAESLARRLDVVHGDLGPLAWKD
ncbi:hypothetical protein ACFWXO_36870 [Kitasatospora sp. NPDC059088]|uniref:hypothetical protein n=1 Tax=Kitasatospora sp. NPDC059088 TaxID=3346722 RepID=UPI0036C62CCD